MAAGARPARKASPKVPSPILRRVPRSTCRSSSAFMLGSACTSVCRTHGTLEPAQHCMMTHLWWLAWALAAVPSIDSSTTLGTSWAAN